MNPRMSMKLRCVRCRMQMELCVCEVFPKLDLSTKVLTLIHQREYWKPSNTGHLVRICLNNSLVKVRRDPINYLETANLIDMNYATFVLFPSADAEELNPKFLKKIKKPIALVVPDGSWRQASKMIGRDPVIRALPRIFLPASDPSWYRLRVETRLEGLATFEAISRALGIIEGNSVREQLEQAFRVFTDRILWTRGRLSLTEAATSLENTQYSPHNSLKNLTKLTSLQQ